MAPNCARIALIHNDRGSTSIAIDERRRQQGASAARCTDALRVGTNEFREVSDVVVGRRVNQLAGLCVTVNRREAKIPDMVRSAILIQQNIPIGPADSAGVEIIDHRIAIAFCIGPILVALS